MTVHLDSKALDGQELSLFENGPVMLFKWKNQPDWPVEYASHNVLEKLGYSAQEFIQGGVSYTDLIHPHDCARVLAEVANLCREPNPFFNHQPYRLIHRAGHIVWVHDHTVIFRDSAGQITHHLGYLIDITEHRNTEESLRQSEERLNLVLKGSGLGTWDCEVQTGRAVFNARWAGMLGYEVHEIDPWVSTWRKMIHPDDKPFVIAALNDHLNGRTPFYRAEYRLMTKSGDWMWVMDNGRIVERDAEGQAVRAAGILKDIDGRKKVERELTLSNERFMNVLNSIDACIYVADIETYEILFMNRYMIESFGQDFTGEPCWQVFRTEGQPCSHCTNPQLLDEERHPTGVKTWQDLNPITGKYYMNYDRAIRWDEKRMAKIQIATDISELKSLEMQLRQKYKMEAVGLMAGGIAHNFNNSLAIILGNLKLAQMKLAAESPVGPHLENAYTTVLRSGELVKQILAYSRQGEYDQQPVRLAQVIEETLKLIRATVPATVDLRCQIAESEQALTIQADTSQIQQVLINLCTNAIHAMAEEGELSISLEAVDLTVQDIPAHYERTAGKYVLLRVQDTGCGMTPEIEDKIFDPFFTTKEVNQGTGMGLSTVQGIIDLHGGLIKVRTRPELGSTFDIFFPLIAPTSPAMTCGSDAYKHGTEHILFLDDDEGLANVGGEMLREFGYRVTTETSSLKALDLFRSDPAQFDLVITDQAMPLLSGKDLLQQMFALKPDLLSILCTGYSNKIDESAAKQQGIKAFFIKPLELSLLLTTVRDVLDKRQSEQS